MASGGSGGAGGDGGDRGGGEGDLDRGTGEVGGGGDGGVPYRANSDMLVSLTSHKYLRHKTVGLMTLYILHWFFPSDCPCCWSSMTLAPVSTQCRDHAEGD